MLDLERVRTALTSYEVGGELGRGAWGIVLEGRHLQLDREVAIKQLPRAFAADPVVRSRFLAEARLLASLDHPHIVPVFDFVESDGLCLLVMEKLSGGTVWSRFTSSGVTAEAACALVLATAAGLHAAHQRGILHRDIKPENLLFSANGQLKVTDFGIAKVVGGNDTMTTRAGEVLGTPQYMAPEQAQAGELGPATDVYATGVMLYELLSGQLPFPEEGDAFAILYRHINEQPAPLSRTAPEIPAAISSVVMQALATDPAYRFPTAEAFGVALAEAATTAWGPGWPLARGNFSVMGSPEIVAATERYSASSGQGPAPATLVRSAMPAVRATTTVRVPPPPPPDDARVILVSVREIVESPPFPTRYVARAAGMILACLLLGLAGFPRSFQGDLPQGAVSVGGVDAAAGEEVRLDLDQEVPVEGTAFALASSGTPDSVNLRLSMGGVSIGSARSQVLPEPDGSFLSLVDLASRRYLAGGRLTGHLSLLAGDSQIAERSFPVKAARSALLTLPGAACVATILFTAAYAESLLRTLRKGRRQRLGRAGLVALGMLMGPALALLASFVAGREPSLAIALLAAALGAAAGFAATKAATDIGRFRRLARTNRPR